MEMEPNKLTLEADIRQEELLSNYCKSSHCDCCQNLKQTFLEENFTQHTYIYVSVGRNEIQKYQITPSSWGIGSSALTSPVNNNLFKRKQGFIIKFVRTPWFDSTLSSVIMMTVD